MKRGAPARPQPGIAFASDDNRVPDMLDASIVAATLVHAGAWLMHGRPAGARRIGAARPTTFRVWLPWISPFALAAAACVVWLSGSEHGVVAEAFLWLGAVGFSAIALLASMLAAAIAHTLPPPRRPGCEGATLPSGEPRRARRPASDSSLFEYVRDEVWLCERPLGFYGFEFGTRMTVLRLEDGGLLLHSPVEIGPDLEASVRALGEPRCIVAPNAIHHLYVAPWREAFPDAAFVSAPGLLSRRPDLAPALEWPLTKQEQPWSDADVAAAVFEGHPMHREIALFHRRSQTLVLSDMIENLGHPEDGLARSQQRLLDLAMMSGRPTPPTDYKIAVDQEALAHSLEPMQSWRFERIVLAHGRLVERDAREVFRDAFAFLI